MSKVVVKRLGVFSLAKLSAVTGAGLGLVIGIPFGLIMIVFGAAIMSQSGGDAAAGAGVGVGLGLFYMIGLPIIYGVFGLIGGAVYALIYNFASGIIGGIEMELETAAPEYGAPPPPSWEAHSYGAGPQQSSYTGGAPGQF